MNEFSVTEESVILCVLHGCGFDEMSLCSGICGCYMHRVKVLQCWILGAQGTMASGPLKKVIEGGHADNIFLSLPFASFWIWSLHFYCGQIMTEQKSINKKVLLCERKRHTAHRVASPCCAALSPGGGGGDLPWSR